MKLKKGSKRAWTWLISQFVSKCLIIKIAIDCTDSLNFVYIILILELEGLICLGLIETEDIIKTLKGFYEKKI